MRPGRRPWVLVGALAASHALVGCGKAGKDDSKEPTDTDTPGESDTLTSYTPYVPPTDTGEERDCTLPEGSEWQLLADDTPGGVLLSAWSNGPDEALIVGGDFETSSGTLMHFQRVEGLCAEQGVVDGVLWWIHGSAPGAWYAVGDHGVVLHDVGGTRVREDVPTEVTLYGVFDDGTSVWAVGGKPGVRNSGEIWRKQGDTWELFAGALPGLVFKVWDGWFVGDKVSWRLEGETLVPVDNPERLLTVRGRSGTDVFAVGGLAAPVVFHWDGAAWAPFDLTGLFAPLNGVWTAPEADVWIAGYNGLIARRVGDVWEQPSPLLTPEHFHAAWGHCREMLFVGGNLTSTSDFHGVIARYGERRPMLDVVACP